MHPTGLLNYLSITEFQIYSIFKLAHISEGDYDDVVVLLTFTKQ